MGKLGISIYPERSTFEKDKAYLDWLINTALSVSLLVYCKSMMIGKRY